MLCHCFGRAVDHVKSVNALMCYDQDYEHELLDAFPLTKDELVHAPAIEYKGSFPFWMGKLIFLDTQTLPGLSYTNQCLLEYSSSPNKIVFASIVWVLSYLTGNILRPALNI